MANNSDTTRTGAEMTRKPYVAPKLTELGEVEQLTQWVGGPWGEFFGGIGDGWNPWGGSGGGTGTSGS